MSLKVSKFSKLYGQKWVLRDISFETEPGKIFGLYGASSSGKSTIINALAGIEKLNGGTINYDSADITGNPGGTFDLVRANNAPDSPLKRFFGSEGPTLPSGELQADALKTAAASTKKVLLLDDLFCSMDRDQRLESFRLLRTVVREKNIIAIFATSRFEDILQLCDTVAVIAGTEVQQIGTPQEVYLEPASHAVARVTGANNLFAARRLTSSKAENPQFQTIEGSHRLTVQKVLKSSLGALNQNVTLGIRPEHISISFGASFPEDNLIKARITGVQFQGPTTLVQLDADGLRLDALVLRLVGLNPGDECMLGLPPDRIAVYKD